MTGYKNLEEMINREYYICDDIVKRKAFGDNENLVWWEGRLDAWKWCKEQLECDKNGNNASTISKRYSINYDGEASLKLIERYGRVLYKSPILDLVILESLYTKDFFLSLEGVSLVVDTVKGKLY